MTDEQNPLTNPAPRTCATCGCANEVVNPQNVAGKELVCTYSQPRVQDQRVRVPDPRHPGKQIDAVQRNIFHMPTLPDAWCMRGWCPKGTPPGGNWQLDAYLKSLEPYLEQVFGHNRTVLPFTAQPFLGTVDHVPCPNNPAVPNIHELGPLSRCIHCGAELTGSQPNG